jgi:hypothetical protein
MLSLVFSLLVSVQDSAPKPEQLEQWVKDLGAEDFKTRDAADKALRAAGKAALPYLDKATQSEDLETRERATGIKNFIEKGPERPTQLQRERPRVRAGANVPFQVWVHHQGDDPYELKMGPDGVELKKDGKSYSAGSTEEFRKRYPDLYEKYVKPNTSSVRVQVRPAPAPKREEPEELEDPFFGMDREWTKHFEDLSKMLDELHKALTKEDEMDKWFEGWMERFEAERKELEKARKEFAEKFRRGWEERGKQDKGDSVDNVTGGRLGALFDVVDSDLRAKYKLGENEGVLVVKIVEESVAGRLGLRANDVITKVGEATITNALQARSEIWKAMRQDEVNVEVVRDGERKTLKAASADLKD